MFNKLISLLLQTRQLFNALILRSPAVGHVAYIVVRLATLQCTSRIIDTVYSSVYLIPFDHGRHKQYDCERGINIFQHYSKTDI